MYLQNDRFLVKLTIDIFLHMDLFYINKFYQNSDNTVLPQREKVPLLACHNTITLCGRCFITIASLAPYLFPSWLVKTESHDTVRSVETYRLGRWTLVAAVMLILFGLLRPDLSPWGYRNGYFLVALCHLKVRRSNLEVVTKRLLHQQVKILG